MNQMRAFYEKGTQNEELEKLKKKFNTIKENLVKEANKIKEAADSDTLMTEKVILVFNTDDEKDEILKEYDEIPPSVIGPYFGLGSEEIAIKEAPEPK